MPGSKHPRQAELFEDASSTDDRRTASPDSGQESRIDARRTSTVKRPAAQQGQPNSARQQGGSGERYLSVREVCRRYEVSPATIWRWVKTDPAFPDPVRLSPGTTRWPLSALERFELARQGR